MNKKDLLEELIREGFSNFIINAFNLVQREDFIPKEEKEFAYLNQPLSIGNGQTISQPYTIAFMLDLLELDNLNSKQKLRLLEVGSGSGYVLALINKLCDCEIFGIERIRELHESSKNILRNYKNIKIIYGDGTLGIKDMKFDRILVSASADKLPEKLIESLNQDGIIVVPVKNSIFKIKKEKEKLIKYEYPGFIFVPLIYSKEK